MFAKKNCVVAGDYSGGNVFWRGAYGRKGAYISYKGKEIDISKETVDGYELVDATSNKSVGSGLARGAGGAMLGLIGGPVIGLVGALAGASSAKSKGLHTIAILFKSGKRALIVLDDDHYKVFLKAVF